VAVDIEAVKRQAGDYADAVRQTLPVDKAVLFGSYAQGSASELSDIDICFFLRDFGGKRRVDVIAYLLDLAGAFKGVFFEPLVFPTSEIERGNPFVQEILATGIEM